MVFGKKKNRAKEIKRLLKKALLQGGKMEYGLYEYDLEEHVDYLYDGLKRDKDEFVFAVNENTGHVAMVLIMPDKTLYLNDEARGKLQEIWPETYEYNMKRLIPTMVNDLVSGNIAVNGVKTLKER